MIKKLKGKNQFTQYEIDELKNLIKERNKIAGTTETKYAQKKIRDKMRTIGFYGKDDWSINDCQILDLDYLIQSGQIKVRNEPKQSVATMIKEEAEKIDKTFAPPSSIQQIGISTIINKFKQNYFDPITHRINNIPDKSGNYIVCLRQKSKLPNIQIKPMLCQFEGLDVIYTGVSSKSLRNRDYKQHFNGQAGRSTLRKSLGVLFGYKRIPRDKDPFTGKTKFNEQDEQKLSNWMKDNLIMYVFPTADFNELETQLINYFNPPLNLKSNSNVINSDFRQYLSKLRANKNL